MALKRLNRLLFAGGSYLTDGTLAQILLNHLGQTLRFAPRQNLQSLPLAPTPGTLDAAAAASFGVYEVEGGPWFIDHIDMHQVEGGSAGSTTGEVYVRYKDGTSVRLAVFTFVNANVDFVKLTNDAPAVKTIKEGDELYCQVTARPTGGSGLTFDVHLAPATDAPLA